MDSGSTHLHVVPSLDSGWVVRETADGIALRRTMTRQGALDDAARTLAVRRGGQITVHTADGTPTARYDVSALGQRPWWYQRPRPWSLISPISLIIAAIFRLLGRTAVLPVWMSIVVLLLAAFSISSYGASKRLDRRQGPLVRVAVDQPRRAFGA